MQTMLHTMSDLFAQLGLANSEADVRDFVGAHRPLAGDVALADASCWTPAQARFLRDEIMVDADWAEVVDQLNLMMHR